MNATWRGGMIFLDGRPLPVDPNPTWNGYSTGHWEKDTLVIQTIGFKDGLWLDANGNPLDNTGKMTERITRPSFRAAQSGNHDRRSQELHHAVDGHHRPTPRSR